MRYVGGGGPYHLVLMADVMRRRCYSTGSCVEASSPLAVFTLARSHKAWRLDPCSDRERRTSTDLRRAAVASPLATQREGTFFFFQAEDGIRDLTVTGVQTCALPIFGGLPSEEFLTKVDPLLAGVRAKLDGPYLTSDHVAGRLTAEWAEKLGLSPGIPIPVGAFDAHWDAMGAGITEGDVVNVIGTATCIMAITKSAECVPGVCGVVRGSIHPDYAGVEAGLSACGYLFESLAKRAGTTVEALSAKLGSHRAGQTGLMHLTWDNGDRTVLVNPNLGGVTLGWNLNHTAEDDLFAAIEGTAFHTR